MRDGDIGHVAIHCPILKLRRVQLRDDEERSGSSRGVPGEDAAVGMAASNRVMVGRDGDGGDGARLNRCKQMSAYLEVPGELRAEAITFGAWPNDHL